MKKGTALKTIAIIEANNLPPGTIKHEGTVATAREEVRRCPNGTYHIWELVGITTVNQRTEIVVDAVDEIPDNRKRGPRNKEVTATGKKQRSKAQPVGA